METLELRRVLSASPSPVLMVIADQRDFYYQEYNDTRMSLEAAGLTVEVAATTTQPSTPHAGSGQGSESGIVTPDIALANVDAGNYSAIVFVGGWGSSMYQYSFSGDHLDDLYDGDPATQETVNNLINDFVDQDKYVTAICHGTTVLAWARVDGVSPLDGKQVSVPWIGSPAVTVDGEFYGNFELMAYTQATENGAIANTTSGQYGDPTTVADDVIVDGRIITAENYDSARRFGEVIAQQVLAQAADETPANQPPTVDPAVFSLAENSPAGMFVGQVSAADPDAGELTYQITSGNTAGAFAIDPDTGAITVLNAAALDFETTPLFQLEVTATDDCDVPLTASAVVTVNLTDVAEPPLPGASVSGLDVIVQGTSAADTIYIWSGAGNQAFVWMNGAMYGPYALPAGGHVIVFGGDGNDCVYATDARFAVKIHGEGGHDQITGGSADDLLDGGDGWDRIWGMGGNDLILGGAGNDSLDGREGNDILLGGAGDDWLAGFDGRDLLVGGMGADRMDGGAGDDLLIGGRTSYDSDVAALTAIQAEWLRPVSAAERLANLASVLRKDETVLDDGIKDCLIGGADADALFAFATDCLYSPDDAIV